MSLTSSMNRPYTYVFYYYEHTCAIANSTNTLIPDHHVLFLLRSKQEKKTNNLRKINENIQRKKSLYKRNAHLTTLYFYGQDFIQTHAMRLGVFCFYFLDVL